MRTLALLIVVAFSLPALSQTLVCNVRDFGASGASALDTKAIQAAVDACKNKSGTVFFPAGTYISGTIRLGSRMTFHLDKGATLQAVRDPQAFPVLTPLSDNTQLKETKRALLYAEGPDGLTIEGPGVIDGSGDFAPWRNVKEDERPIPVWIFQSDGLVVRDLNVRNSAMWSVVLMETQDSRVSNLNVDSRIGNTRDGLDIVDGEDIRVDHATIFSEDDSICLKSGSEWGLHNVWITNSHIQGSLVANGLKFGTASRGPLSDIHFENIVIEHVAQAAMALESVDGSVIDGVSYKNIKYSDTGSGVFVLLGWRGDQKNPHVGAITNVSFDGINGESSRQSWGSVVSGTEIDGVTHALANISFSDVHMRFKGNDKFVIGSLPSALPEYAGQYPDPRMWPESPAQGLLFRHVKHVEFKNVQLAKIPSKDSRPVLLPSGAGATFDAP